MIEVGSFIGMAAMTKSEITIKNVSYENLGIIPESFRRLGIKLEQRGDDIYRLIYDRAAGDVNQVCALFHDGKFRLPNTVMRLIREVTVKR